MSAQASRRARDAHSHRHTRERRPLHNRHTGEGRYPEGWGLARMVSFTPEFPISKCLGANKVPSSTRAIVVSHGCRQPSNQAHKTIRRRELAAVRQRRHLSLRLHSPPTPPGTHLPLGYLSSPLMTSRIFATLVLDGARLYAPTLAGIPPGTLPPQEAETPTSWHAAPDVHPS